MDQVTTKVISRDFHLFDYDFTSPSGLLSMIANAAEEADLEIAQGTEARLAQLSAAAALFEALAFTPIEGEH